MRVIEDGSPPDPRAVELTRRILISAVAQRWVDVAHALWEVLALGSGPAVATLFYGCADSHIAAHERLFGPLPAAGRGGAVAPQWVDVRTGRVASCADDVADCSRWAGRFVAARAAADRDQCQALLAVLAGLDPDELVETAAAVVVMAADMIRSAPCGCGRHQS